MYEAVRPFAGVESCQGNHKGQVMDFTTLIQGILDKCMIDGECPVVVRIPGGEEFDVLEVYEDDVKVVVLVG